MRLDLKTIKKLQQSGPEGENKKNLIEKKEHFKKLLNKSFWSLLTNSYIHSSYPI